VREREWGVLTKGPRGCGLSIPQKFHFHILHSCNTAIFNNNFSSAPRRTRVSLSRVFSAGEEGERADRTGYIVDARARVRFVERTVLFFVFDMEARGPIPSATKIKYARGGERGKTYFEINEQN